MNVDLKVFHYQILGHLNKEPKLVDNEFLKIENTPELLKSQHTRWSFTFKATEKGHEVYIQSTISIPAGEVHNDSTFDGTFYSYEGNTLFLVTDEEITEVIVGELALVHLSRFQHIIAEDTMRKTNGKNVYSTVMFCLSKLILTASEQFDKKPAQ